MRSNLLIYNNCNCPMGAHNIWETPNYRCIIKEKGSDVKTDYKKFIIKVINSAPSYTTITPSLESIFDEIFNDDKLNISSKSSIMDFGAGKLKSTIHLLNKTLHNIYPVEFKELEAKQTAASAIMHKNAARYRKRLNKIQFPHNFFKKNFKVDLVIAINVHNVMPVPAERLLSILYAREKLKEGGYYLYYGQCNDPKMLEKCKSKNKIGDGYFMGKGRKHKTFYHNYNKIDEIDIMFYMNGFRRVIKKTIPINHALLYKKVGINPLTSVFNAKTIKKYVDCGGYVEKDNEDLTSGLTKGFEPISTLTNKNKITDLEPTKLRDEKLMINALNKLPAGRKYASAYQHLIAAIFLKLFTPGLAKSTIEKQINTSHDSIDITLTNHAETGFFSKRNNSKIVMIECKNFKTDSAKAFAQLITRFNSVRGKFGIICYRKDSTLEKYDNLIKRCQDALYNEHEILCLKDRDIIKLLEYNLSNSNKVHEYLTEKYDELLDT